MDFLFTRKYKYTISKPLAESLEDFSAVAERKWYDFSRNITGTLKDDNSFRLTHKWMPGSISGIFGNDFAYLKGKISGDKSTTVIETTLSPNIGIVLCIYLLAGVFFCELLGVIHFFDGSKALTLAIVVLFIIILAGLIFYMTDSLRRTFEKILKIKPD